MDIHVEKIQVKDVKVGMTIMEDIEYREVVITEAWADQGKGLGIVLKGTRVGDGRPWQCRFVDTHEELDLVVEG